MNAPTVGSGVVDILAAAGVRRFYTVPGESFLEILDAVERHPDLRLVSTRHEGGASFMAEADAKLSGVPAVAMATRGVGAANLAIGVHTAYQDSTPMIVLLGQVESGFLHREAFQEVDLTAFYAPITKWSVTASRADRIPELITRAIHIATSGRPGPVMIALPSDLLAEEAPEVHSLPSIPSVRSNPIINQRDAQEISDRLVRARNPVIIVGGGARTAREAVVRLAETFSAGVYVGFRRQDAFPNDHPLFLGHLTVAPVGRTLEMLEAADVVLIIGCRMGEITSQGYKFPRPGTDVIQIDINPDSFGAVAHLAVGVVADASSSVKALIEAAPVDLPHRDWGHGHDAWNESACLPALKDCDGVDPAQAMRLLIKYFPSDAIITNDAGNFSAFVHRYWRFNYADTQLGPTNGAMGYAIPAAVAAKIAQPHRTVVATVGDGGFLMTASEIEVAVREQAAIKIVVFRNGLYGTIALHQAKAFKRLAAVNIGEVDLAGYSRALGADAVTVAHNADLDAAFARAAESERVFVIDLVCDANLITPTSCLSEAFGAEGES